MSDAVLVAGGTGGHINAALALGEEFERRGLVVDYISGQRYLDYQLYAGKNCRHLASYPLLGKGPLFMVKSVGCNLWTLMVCLWHFWHHRPRLVFGAGGYVCGPVLLAAHLLRIPVFILEQNSVMGLTNRLLAKIARTIFTSFGVVKGLGWEQKVSHYGNPLSREFFAPPPPAVEDGRFHLLVFGGSLGSRDINQLLAEFMAHCQLPFNLAIVHQTGKNHGLVAKVNPHHQSSEAPITYQQVEYLAHMVRHYHWADLVVCRGGASTISELRVVKTAALIAPIYFHADQHQVHNAQALKAEADFPVHVLSPQELRVGGHKELQHLIIKQYNRGQRDVPHGGMAEENNPTTLIVQAVLSSV